MQHTFKSQCLFSLLVCAVTLLLQNCGKADRQEVTHYDYEQPDTTKSLIASADYRFADTITIDNHHYEYVIERHAADSLPIITDDEGDKYADNIATLSVHRDGNQIFKRTFYKSTFRHLLPRGFYHGSVLDGMAFERPDGANLRFVASVSNPGTDLFVPILITIDPNGNFTMVKSDELETTPPDSSVATLLAQ